MAVNIKSARVDELLEQLRALTGQGPTETELPALEQKASATARPFDSESLYDADGLPA